jgi:hypothetical protein
LKGEELKTKQFQQVERSKELPMNITTGPAREKIDMSELLQWQQRGTIITDDRRRRPLWFDGRFLDARALNAEQDYFLGRQSDLGRIAGFGVITGLAVRLHPDRARTVIIEAGHGITPSGSQVVLPNQLVVDLAAVAETRLLDASFGIADIPRATPFNRTGLFIVALRSVEYTGNPISAYPTRLDAPRTVHDGSVIEATAVTLIPYPDPGASSELARRRSQVAREIFFEESRKGQPDDVLPLAILALDHGVIRWLDLFLVRREISLRERGVWGLGLAPHALRAAQLRQYDTQLRELQAQLGSAARIIAAEHFSVLPPAGPMPVSGVNGTDFTHSFFPAEMDVELSIVPEDELPALLDEAMLLPPLDLALTGDAQESTSVLVVMPVARHQFRRLAQSLPTLSRDLPAAQPGMLAKRKPITALTQLLARRALPTLPDVVLSTDSLWRAELAKQARLWYLRRRNLHYKAEMTSWSVTLLADETNTERLVNDRITALGLNERFSALTARTTSSGRAELTAFLASPLLRTGSATTVKAAVAELEKAETVDRLAVLKVEERFTDPAFGEGLARLEKSSEAFTGDSAVAENVAKSGMLPELDRLSRTLPKEEFKVLTEKLAEAGNTTDTAAVEKVTKVITEKVAATGTAGRTGPIVTRPLSTTAAIRTTR